MELLKYYQELSLYVITVNISNSAIATIKNEQEMIFFTRTKFLDNEKTT